MLALVIYNITVNFCYFLFITPEQLHGLGHQEFKVVPRFNLECISVINFVDTYFN